MPDDTPASTAQHKKAATPPPDSWLVNCLLPGAEETVVITVKSCRDGGGEPVGPPFPPSPPAAGAV